MKEMSVGRTSLMTKTRRSRGGSCESSRRGEDGQDGPGELDEERGRSWSEEESERTITSSNFGQGGRESASGTRREEESEVDELSWTGRLRKILDEQPSLGGQVPVELCFWADGGRLGGQLGGTAREGGEIASGKQKPHEDSKKMTMGGGSGSGRGLGSGPGSGSGSGSGTGTGSNWSTKSKRTSWSRTMSSSSSGRDEGSESEKTMRVGENSLWSGSTGPSGSTVSLRVGAGKKGRENEQEAGIEGEEGRRGTGYLRLSRLLSEVRQKLQAGSCPCTDSEKEKIERRGIEERIRKENEKGEVGKLDLPPQLNLILPLYQPLSLSPFSPLNHSLSDSLPLPTLFRLSASHPDRMIHPLPQRSRPPIDPIHYVLPEASRSAPDLCSPLVSPNALENTQWVWNHDRCHSDRHHEAARLERRFQALLEIFDTELGYLRDLKLLEDLYLKKLDLAPFLKIHDKLIVRRNFAHVLDLADRFGRRLSLAVGSKLDLWRNAPYRDESEVDKIIERVAKAFISESPIFTVYEEFCARHTEAADVIRAFDSSPEWIALLHQPASPASDSFFPSPPSPLAPATTPTIRLSLQDFVIKPIQRIMRYPMLLNSLLKHMNGDINPSESRAKDKVYQALWAMKEVAEAVDEAKSLREVQLRTELIASRMELHSSYRSAFICLLGQIKLVGSLHILYHGPVLDPSEAFKIKYHGIFLYQTHIVIVKVKRATVYEPRHWFPIRYFDLVDIPDSSGLMPYSFSLKYRQHTFEFGATCEQEKKCWVSKLRELKEEIENLRTMQILSDVPLGDDSIVSSIMLSESGTNQTHLTEGPPRTGSPVEEEVLCVAPEEPMVVTPSATQSRVSQRLSRNVNTLFGRTAEVAQAAIDLKLTEVFSDVLLCARLQEAGTEAGARARTLSATVTSTKRLSQVTLGRPGGERKLKRMSYMEPTTRTFEMVPPLPRVLNSSPEGSSSGSSLRRANSGPTHVSGPAPAPSDVQLLDDTSDQQHEGTKSTAAVGVDQRHSHEEQSRGSCTVEKDEERKADDSATMRSTQSLGGSHWLPGLKMVRRLSRVGVRNYKKDSDEGIGAEKSGSESNHQCKSTGTESKKGRMKRQTSTPLPSTGAGAAVQQMSWRRGFMRKKQSGGGCSRDENGSSSSSEKENHRKAEEEGRRSGRTSSGGWGTKNTMATGTTAGPGAGNGGGIGSVFRSMMRLSPLGDAGPSPE